MSALVIGMIIPALLTSPFGLYALLAGASKYYFKRRDFTREVKRLEKKGFIALTKVDKGWAIKLLEKGKEKQTKIKFKNLSLKREATWDGKWRLFIFDVPEEFRTARKLLNGKLKQLGFFNVQRSVYVYPYKCKQELDLISDYYGISKYTLYSETDYIDVDKPLRKHFGL